MGLAASQARMLMLFARKSDLEFRGQTINQRRLAIAYQQAEMAQDLSEALSNRVLKVKKAGDELDITCGNLSLVSMRAYVMVEEGGVSVKKILSEKTDETDSDPYHVSGEELEEGLRGGRFYIEKLNETETYTSVDWRTNTTFEDQLDTTDDEMSQAHYDSEMALVHAEDKRFEIELKNVETQHSAVQTEIDAVKKVIDKNIETSFKTFG